ncbi:hypothetical protein GGR42_002579 [Saonia flava]|uniref:Lipid/polyisoprenoid-binding YceI-like domain-containing protein n=1 Tax=Saonia flava TaxID=523696 RepID=A0A846QVR8_9FLAO|nr:YceI family protein [Saonia flava]NJB72088.1 hypothetical protein [Saonia flava]
MRKWIFIEMLVAMLIVTSGCKDFKKGVKEGYDDAQKEAEKEEMYVIQEDSTAVSFTAYKTTKKLPVGGKFNTINLNNVHSGNTITETLDGLKFSIPVSSLFTNDATGTRDPKIIEFFFGMMADTELISGVLVFDENKKCTVDLSLNGVTASLPMDYELTEDNHVVLNGTLNLEKWNALDALASLNKACEILHTGEDGVSKTWSDVAINASVLLEKK